MIASLLMLSLGQSPLPDPAIVAPPKNITAKPIEPELLAKTDAFPVELQKKLLSGCARMTSLRSDIGTGAVVAIREGSAYLLTARHVMSSLSEMQCEFFPAENRYQPIVVKPVNTLLSFANTDFAIVKVPLKGLTESQIKSITVIPLPKPFDRPKVMQLPLPALSIGCDYGALPTAKAETIRARKLVKRQSELTGAFFWQVDSPPVQGRSGGPLLDRKGQLIGICVASRENLGYFLHLDEIHAHLKSENYEYLWDSRQ